MRSWPDTDSFHIEFTQEKGTQETTWQSTAVISLVHSNAFRSDVMATMSIRGLDERVLSQLKKQASEEGGSLNSLVLRLLQGSSKTGATPLLQQFDDLDALAGTWSSEDCAIFMKNTAAFSEPDSSLWQ